MRAEAARGTGKTRVLIVDDHAVVRAGIAAVVAAEPDMEVCGEAANANEALRLVETLQPDIAILDLGLDDSSGFSLLKDMQSRGSPTKVLVVSGRDETLYAHRCVRAGAFGFLNKGLALEEIVEGIHRVRDGGYCLGATVTAEILGSVSSRPGTSDAEQVQGLSDRELQVYEAIGAGLSVKEVAARLTLSPKTVDTYRTKIKQKLGLNSSQLLARHAVLWASEQMRS